MKNAIILLCCLITCSVLSAQNQVSGTVYDQNQQPVYYANVAIYQLPDSTLINGSATDEDGNFVIRNISDGDYYLVSSMIGSVDAMSDKFSLSGGASPAIDLQLLPDNAVLSEVEITARKPLLEQRADRMIVNVADNITSANGSLLDVMRKVPGMLVVNDKLSLAGQQNVTILLNGRTTRYMDVQSLLRDMPGDNIKSVEIIHQPGAEFEASGSGPIINIITKKNNLFGTNGTASAGIGYTNDWKYNTGLRLSHYQGGLNLQGSVGYSRNSWEDVLQINRRVPNGTDTPDVYDQVNTSPTLSNTLRAGFVADWDVTDEHRIGFNTRIIDSNNDYVSTNVTIITTPNNTGEVVTANDRVGGWDMYTINPYYEWQIDTSGQKLELDANWVDFDITRVNTLNNSANEASFDQPDRINDQLGDNKIFTSRLDYSLPINDMITLKAGGKYSDAQLDNDLVVSDEIGGVFQENPFQSNRYQFSEEVKAVYGKAEYKFGDITGTFGLRYENSLSEGYSVTLDSLLSRRISKLFPSASITKPIAGPLAANLAYSYRIDRPSYSTLNPFRYYYDPFTSERGNPNIRPELTHSYKFSLSYEGQPFFNVEYKQSSDNMVEVTEQNDASGEIFRQTINLDKFANFNTSLFLPFDMFLPFGGYIGGILNHNNYDSEYLGGQFDQDAWSFTAFTNINFQLPGDIATELGAWYQSGGQEGIIDTDWLYGTSANVSKKFLDNNLRVSVGIEDVFNRFWTGQIRYQNMDGDIASFWPNNVVNFRVSYKFGNQHMKSKKKSGSSANDELRRINTGG